ncbi:L-threonylcarbamoyladenylate synthase [Porphyromonas loveana]|uniref:L-threonylcarbamoyladenylate synthase n=1 Tax=Porphyromonas loveana TaxID=1884669 RepID=UPI00359FE60A
MELEFEIKKDSLTPGGNIPYEYNIQIQEHFRKGGIIICPSDTCYSIAAACLPGAYKIGNYLNTILCRNSKWPFSVAFGSVMMVEKYISPNSVCISLLDCFSPGPITAVCDIAEAYRSLSRIIHSEKDDTIGIRIPDSNIERRLADLAKHPITTVQAKIGETPPIKDYEVAKNCIINSIKELGWSKKLPVAGIEGAASFTEKLSTVVRVKELGSKSRLEIIREGYISKDALRSFLSDNEFINWSITVGNI